MSGPKTSRYRMTPEQLKQLQEELEKRRQEQIRREKIKKEREKLSKELSELKEMMLEATQNIDEMKLISVETNDVLKNMDRLIHSDNIVEIQNGIQLLKRKKEEIYDKMLAHVRGEKDENRQKIFEKVQILAAGFAVSFDGLGSNEKNETSKYEELIVEKLKGISLQNLSTELKNKWIILSKQAKSIKDTRFLENFYNISIVPFVKECQNFCNLYEKYGIQYEMLIAEYKELIKEIGGEEKDFTFSLESLKALERLVHDMKICILSISEQEYISRSIDEAMEEMGYALVGHREVIKKNGKKFRNELYHFSEGTAVNVTYANNGQITMELGAIDAQDRMPTDRESEKLTEDMIKFCREYGVLEKILEKKGIIRKNIQILPPSAEYAQVINICKYDMYEELERFHINKQRKNDEKERYIY